MFSFILNNFFSSFWNLTYHFRDEACKLPTFEFCTRTRMKNVHKVIVHDSIVSTRRGGAEGLKEPSQHTLPHFSHAGVLALSQARCARTVTTNVRVCYGPAGEHNRRPRGHLFLRHCVESSLGLYNRVNFYLFCLFEFELFRNLSHFMIYPQTKSNRDSG